MDETERSTYRIRVVTLEICTYCLAELEHLEKVEYQGQIGKWGKIPWSINPCLLPCMYPFCPDNEMSVYVACSIQGS